jgi:hypothetical protein
MWVLPDPGRSRSHNLATAGLLLLTLLVFVRAFGAGGHREPGIGVGVVFLLVAVAYWAYVPSRHPPHRQALIVLAVVGIVGTGSVVAAVVSLVRHRSPGYVIVYGVAGAFLLAAELFLLVRLRRLRGSLRANDTGRGGYAGKGDPSHEPGSFRRKP